MSRVDLDAIEALARDAERASLSRQATQLDRPLTRYEVEIAYADANRFASAAKPQVVLALVASCRAAGKLADVANEVLDGRGVAAELRAALADYRKAVNP